MSIEAARKYLNKLSEDNAFKKKIINAKDNASRLKIAKEAGLIFTPSEIKMAQSEILETSGIDQVKSFLKSVKTDRDFAKKVASAKSPDERMKVIRNGGFHFSRQQLVMAKNLELSDDESRELGLSDKDLRVIAGGGCGYTHEGEGHCGHTHEGEGHCGFTHEPEAAQHAPDAIDVVDAADAM